jgi:hypothetical protein
LAGEPKPPLELAVARLPLRVFAPLLFTSYCGNQRERHPAMEERGFEQSLSVFICVHLWLHCMVTA